jgi:anhydro-N-acetylmuramic acid kinase
VIHQVRIIFHPMKSMKKPIYYTNNTVRILGIMTGTSADGMDLCLVEFTGNDVAPTFRIVDSASISYPADFKQIFSNPTIMDFPQIQRYDTSLAQWMNHEISALKLDFDFIANHGQTIFHQPPDFTLQIGNAAWMADLLHSPVIHDFRSADMRATGQGAPLIPIVDKFLLQCDEHWTSALNIGGISNISFIPPSCVSSDIMAFDTGPGNMLLDQCIEAFTKGENHFDIDGKFAAEGKVDDKLLAWLIRHPYFSKPIPKSTGREDFGDDYFKSILEFAHPTTRGNWLNLVSTLTEFTVQSIVTSINQFNTNPIKEIFVSGGGALNKEIMRRLSKALAPTKISILKKNGIDSNNKEAFGFAYLGYLFLNGFPGNIPSVTGATHHCVLGNIVFPSL